MIRSAKFGWVGSLGVLALMLSLSPLFAGPVSAADKAVTRSAEPAEGHELVDIFEGMESGEIEVRLIPRDSTRANVIIKNSTDKSVAVKMPEAFAGVPVLAQGIPGGGGGLGGGGGGFGGGGGPGGGGGFGGGGGGNQGFGGGFGGGGGGFGGGGGGFGGGGGGLGGGGGVFNIAPGRTGKVEIGIVCLEHGKEDPNPKVEYTLKPIESFTDDQRVIELCKLAAQSDAPQTVIQAAAWHLTDNLSWAELAAKDRVRLSNGYFEKYFSPRDLHFAQQAVAIAEERAEAYSSVGGSANGQN